MFGLISSRVFIRLESKKKDKQTNDTRFAVYCAFSLTPTHIQTLQTNSNGTQFYFQEDQVRRGKDSSNIGVIATVIAVAWCDRGVIYSFGWLCGLFEGFGLGSRGSRVV